jgi:hypothetical protein
MIEVRIGHSSTARQRDTSLATAVSLSARFPWVMPAGRLPLQNGPARLVDGGYVENSGAETALDLVQTMSWYYDAKSNPRGEIPLVQMYVISITNLQILQAQGTFGLGELLSPIRTMLSAREARAVVSLFRLIQFSELCQHYAECGGRVGFIPFLLNLYDFDLPLGWLLADSTKTIVKLHCGVAGRAGTYLGGNNIDDRNKFERLGAYAKINDSSACNVVSILQGQQRNCDRSP